MTDIKPIPKYLQELEDEAIFIIRETVAVAENPVLLYSIGKDSNVILKLLFKAFAPATPPVSLLHIDTTWKFKEMIKFRDYIEQKYKLKLYVHINQSGVDMNINPFVHGSKFHTNLMKTEALKQALDKYKFDHIILGSRRDEEKSRAKERIFSVRNRFHVWDPKNQQPEFGWLFNTRLPQGFTVRISPIANWTEYDVWNYILYENIEIPELYFSKERPVVEVDGMLIMVDDDRMSIDDKTAIRHERVRFRTLGCYPLTGAIRSEAQTVQEIIEELRISRDSERQGRLIDQDSTSSMEQKKKMGYF
jgi:sulfate adenylyltransferase subunit 2